MYRLSILILSLILLVSCSEEKKPLQGQKQRVCLLLDWLPNPNHTSLYVAKEKGLFEKYGIDLEIMKILDWGDTLPFLSTGRADLAVYYMPQTLKAASKKLPAKVVASLISHPLNAFLVRKDSGIEKIEDLNGKSLGSFFGTLEGKMIHYLCQKKGLSFGEVRKMELDPSAMLKMKLVDAVTGVCWNIESMQLEEEGVPTNFFRFEDLGVPNYHELVVLGNATFLEKNPSIAKSFIKAMNESVDFCQKNPKEAFSLYVKANPDKSKRTVNWEKKAWEQTLSLYPKDSSPDRKTWENFALWMKKQELLGEELNLNALFLP